MSKLTRIHSNLDPCCATFQKAAAKQKLAKVNVTPHRVAISGQHISLKSLYSIAKTLQLRMKAFLQTTYLHFTPHGTGYGVSIHYTNTNEHEHKYSNATWWPRGAKTRLQALKRRKGCTLPILLTFKSKTKSSQGTSTQELEVKHGLTH